MKVLCQAFINSQFGFVIFWQTNIGTKAACKMLLKMASEGSILITYIRSHSVLPTIYMRVNCVSWYAELMIFLNKVLRFTLYAICQKKWHMAHIN
jgi:hypothetical protein